MIEKKMKYFLGRLNHDFRMNTQIIDQDFYERLSRKTEVSETRIKELFTTYEALRKQEEITREEYIKFNRLLQQFKIRKK